MEHFEEFKNKIEINDGTLPFEDNTGADRKVGELELYGEFVDLDKRITVVNPDNPVLYLEQEAERNILEVDDLRNVGESSIADLLKRGKKLVDGRKFGIAEFNHLAARLKVALDERGTPAQLKLVKEWEIKP